MKKYFLSSLKLTGILIVLLGFLYPLLIRGVAYLAPGSGEGVRIFSQGKEVGFREIGQSFREDRYFWGRPSAVDYNAGGSGGSNKSIFNPAYIRTMKSRISTFLEHNPGVKSYEIPVEMITASGSGLDPDISRKAALIQVKRISVTRKISQDRLNKLVNRLTTPSFLGILGPEKVNVLALNMELDKLK